MIDKITRRLTRAAQRKTVWGAGLLLLILGWVGLTKPSPAPLSESETRAVYATPRLAVTGPLTVFHLGHSLVGRDMPAFLQQLAPDGHGYNSQLGWGTPLKTHWEPDQDIQGFDTENDHPNYRDAKEALASGDYDAVVLTEMVEIEAAIDYFDSADYLAKWADAAWAGNPQANVFLYESWHQLDDPQGWLTRLDLDLERYWQVEVLRRALARDPQKRPIYLIPAGQVMAEFTRRLEADSRHGPITTREDLFQRDAAGTLDPIHVNDFGNYLVALTHFAVLYQRTPVGLPSDLTRADGSKMQTIPPEIAALMQDVVWSVVAPFEMAGIP